MKVLIYGAGVIGSYLTHVLCAAGNDVTLLARGNWRETLEKNGLRIVHHLQRKTTHDQPRIIGALGREHYDLVFAVMQYGQMWKILDDLVQIDAPLVVLVGNNMDAKEMERYIQAHATIPKTVLFGFQGTGGRREDGKVICVRFGEGSMSLGGVLSEAPESARTVVSKAFQGTKYRLTWVHNMDAWYKCHLVFILPVCYLSYALDCNLTRARGFQIKQVLAAAEEGYKLLDALSFPILPEDTLDKLHGVKGGVSLITMWIMAKTAIGRLAATDHCRHAVAEMEALDKAFVGLREQKPDLPMPNWNALRSSMPDWSTLRMQYRQLN